MKPWVAMARKLWSHAFDDPQVKSLDRALLLDGQQAFATETMAPAVRARAEQNMLHGARRTPRSAVNASRAEMPIPDSARNLPGASQLH
jgi:hypothetical protein